MIPTVSQLASKIVVNMNMNPNDVDNRLLAGDAQVDFAGTGVQAAARAKILSNPNLKAQADDPITGFGWFFYIDSQVAPFTNLACRQAIEYAANHLTLQNAYGGPVAGGAIGSTVHAADRGRATRSSTCTRRPRRPRATRPRPSSCCRPAASRTASPPGSPTAATGPPRPRAPRPCSRRCRRSASRPPCTATRRATLLHQLRGRAEVHELAQHRDRLRRLGCRLAGRIRLPQPAGQRAVHRPGR